MSNPRHDSEDSASEEGSSPILFEDSQPSDRNISVEVLDDSKNDSKETNFGTDPELAIKSKEELSSQSQGSQGYASPMRPSVNLFGSQQSHMSTSSPLTYPRVSPIRSLSLSKNSKCSTHMQPITEDSPISSLTPMDDEIGSFGSLSGLSDHGTPQTLSDRHDLHGKRKAVNSSDSDLELLEEKHKDSGSSLEKPARKRPRESIECIYQSTPQRPGSRVQVPSFRSSDVSDEGFQMKSIPEEIDTCDDIGNLHFSPSQDVDQHRSENKQKSIKGLTKLLTPDSQDTGSDSNGIFSQVTKMVNGSSGSSDSSVTITADKRAEKDSGDTLDLESSSDPSVIASGTFEPYRKIGEKQKKTVEEGLILIKIKYTPSEDGMIMENPEILWQMPVVPEVGSDTSSSLRSNKSSSPASLISDTKSSGSYTQHEPVLKCARYSVTSSSSSSSGSSAMLPPALFNAKIPQEAYKFLHKNIILKKDNKFSTDGLLQLVPPPALGFKQGVVLPEPVQVEAQTPSTVVKKKPRKANGLSSQRNRKKAGNNTQSAKKIAGAEGSEKSSVSTQTKSCPASEPGSSGQASPELDPLPQSPQVQVDPDPAVDPKPDSLPQESGMQEEHIDDFVLRPGKVVFAKWKDSLYYPGTTGDPVNGKWNIFFDDGGRRQVLEEDVMVINKLPVGQPILAAPEMGPFYPGIIYSHVERSTTEMLYQVDLDQKGQHDVPRSQLCMNQEQINILRGDTAVNPLLTTPHRHDVSLDNIMEGKRSRSSKRQLQMDNSSRVPTRRSAKAAESKPGCSKNLDEYSYSDSTTHNEMQAWQSDWERIPGVEEEGDPPEPPAFINLKSKNNKAKEEWLGPIPTKAIFKGYIFCLSYRTGQDSGSQSEVSEADSQDPVIEDKPLQTYDRIHLTQQLTKGGGTVVKFFEHYQLRKDQNKCLMITNRCNTSAKTIMSLAFGVPSVRFTWVIDCCKQDKFLPPALYILPAGYALHPKKRIEWVDNIRKKAKPFQEFSLAVVSDKGQSFLDFWHKVLVEGKARKVMTFAKELFCQKDKPLLRNMFDIIITDEASKDLVELADSLPTPLLHTSWVVQSLIYAEPETFELHQFNSMREIKLSKVMQGMQAS